MFRRLSLPDNSHPLVRRLFEEMNHQQIGILDMSKRSGVNKNTINDWKRRSVPQVHNLEACFSVLGLRMTVAMRREETDE